MTKVAKIRCPGALAKHLVVESPRTSCGEVQNGIGVRFEGLPHDGFIDEPWEGSFVLSWEDFEAAYLAVKKAREF